MHGATRPSCVFAIQEQTHRGHDAELHRMAVHVLRVGRGIRTECERRDPEEPPSRFEPDASAEGPQAAHRNGKAQAAREQRHQVAEDVWPFPRSGHAEPHQRPVDPRHQNADDGGFIGVKVPANEELVVGAIFQQVGAIGRVRQVTGVEQVLRGLAEDGVVDGEGAAIEERFDGGESAAIVPASGIVFCAECRDEERDRAEAPRRRWMIREPTHREPLLPSPARGYSGSGKGTQGEGPRGREAVLNH